MTIQFIPWLSGNLTKFQVIETLLLVYRLAILKGADLFISLSTAGGFLFETGLHTTQNGLKLAMRK